MVQINIIQYVNLIIVQNFEMQNYEKIMYTHVRPSFIIFLHVKSCVHVFLTNGTVGKYKKDSGFPNNQKNVI